MYEGSAEKAILEILFENKLLILDEEDLLEGQIFKRCSLAKFCKEHMGHMMSNTVILIRVIDSLKEKPKIPVTYQHKFENEIVTILTRPEIEILNILAEDKYNDFLRNHHGQKPKDYCMQMFGYRPTYKYNRKYWSLINTAHFTLIECIEKYDKIASSKEYNLKNLLK